MNTIAKIKQRCPWCGSDPTYIAYHDSEWGTPSFDERHLFEKLCLETAQAGLSWITILRKREAYRRAFDNFDAEKIATYTEADVERCLGDPGIVRNRLKIRATIHNAQAYLRLKQETGGLAPYLWDFVGGQTIRNQFASVADVPAQTPLSQALSKDLKKRGFKFVGPTICYAYMQSVGLVDDHLTTCWRRTETPT